MDWLKKLSRRRFIKLAGGTVAGITAFSIMGCSSGSVKQAVNNTGNNGAENTADYTPVFPRHEAYGKGIGAMPGRVVWAHDPKSVNWDGRGYWWELGHFDESTILQMTQKGIAALAAAATAREGWEALFKAHNSLHGQQEGYKQGQKIAIKANINGAAEFDDDYTGSSHHSYTNPVVLKSLLVSLVQDGGVKPENITVFDVTRIFPDYMQELCQEGVTNGVNFVSRINGEPDMNVPVVWSAHDSSVINYLPTCVTEADYLINLATLKGHDYGITLCAKNHFGSFINDYRLRAPQQAQLHGNVSGQKMGDYSVLTDLMGNYQLGAKTMLYMFDALICPSGNTVNITPANSTWQMAPFNNNFTASLFFSQDGVAIDSVGADFLMNEPTVINNNSALKNNPDVENYLHEAALIADAPSGTVYYDGNGQKIENIGVHDHWNNPQEKKYSRNLGKAEGIELIYVKI
ncbi:MAG TPA: DUF362 domain-containing protein [Candidatus Megamonas gallistercoris]|nr:DUF362 domain-containing protein [Candidatus Megamonas gallistercoris]